MTSDTPNDKDVASSPAAVSRDDSASERRLVRGFVRALLADLRANPTSGAPITLADSLTRVMAQPTTSANENDYIYRREVVGDGDGATAPFLSIVLLGVDGSPWLLNDALVALDAQSDDDFEVIVVAPDPTTGGSSIETMLRRFSAGLASRTRIVAAPNTPGDATPRLAALRTGAALARGRYLSFLNATDVPFGHYVETLSRLARTSPRGVLRARALRQPLRRVAWRGDEPGFEPAAGAASASSARFSVLDHLVAPATPPGSYALRHDFATDLATDPGINPGINPGIDVEINVGNRVETDSAIVVDEDEALVEAALLAGVIEGPDDVIVLLRTFEA